MLVGKISLKKEYDLISCLGRWREYVIVIMIYDMLKDIQPYM